VAKKHQKHCDACRLDEGARFRTLANAYLCTTCYRTWVKTGKMPDPVLDDQDDREEERRW